MCARQGPTREGTCGVRELPYCRAWSRYALGALGSIVLSTTYPTRSSRHAVTGKPITRAHSNSIATPLLSRQFGKHSRCTASHRRISDLFQSIQVSASVGRLCAVAASCQCRMGDMGAYPCDHSHAAKRRVSATRKLTMPCCGLV